MRSAAGTGWPSTRRTGRHGGCTLDRLDARFLEVPLSYRIEPRESPAQAVRRIAHEQIEKTRSILDDPEVGPHERVHEVRKRCKKIRGLLRLVRPAFEDTYATENAWYRDAARELSDLRDAAAFIECFDTVMERCAGSIDRRRFSAFRDRLVERRDALSDAQDVRARLAAFRDRIEAGRHRIDEWELDADGFEAVGPGLGKTYARARRAMTDAYEAGTAECFHEWRKRVKYHRYHCRLIRRCWKPVLDARHDEVDRLADRLGDGHDVDALAATLRDEEARFGPLANLEDLLALLDRRRTELRKSAGPLGRAVFAEKPKRFVGRVERYWAAWTDAQSLRRKLVAEPAARSG